MDPITFAYYVDRDSAYYTGTLRKPGMVYVDATHTFASGYLLAAEGTQRYQKHLREPFYSLSTL